MAAESGCSDLPFAPAHLPAGWGYELQPGSGGLVGVPLDEQSPKAIGHWSKGQGRYIDVLEKGEYYVLTDDASRVKLFGGVVRARIGAVHEGFAAEFKVRRCQYSIVAFGLAWGPFRDVLEGLMLIDARVGSEDGYAVWPRLTPRSDLPACRKFPSWRSEPLQVAKRFVHLGLGIFGSLDVLTARRAEMSMRVISSTGREVATLVLEDKAFDCWAVTHVSGPQAASGVHSVSFQADRVTLVFDTDSEVPTVQVKWVFEGLDEEGKILTGVVGSKVYKMRMSYDPDTPGRVLLLFLDEDRALLRAFGMPLPARDFQPADEVENRRGQAPADAATWAPAVMRVRHLGHSRCHL